VDEVSKGEKQKSEEAVEKAHKSIKEGVLSVWKPEERQEEELEGFLRNDWKAIDQGGERLLRHLSAAEVRVLIDLQECIVW